MVRRASLPGLALLFLLACLPWGCSEALAPPADGGADADEPDADHGDSATGCQGVECPSGTECHDGRCLPIDPCAEVVCPNPGEACDPTDGSCRPGFADDDGDGYRLVDGDCNDSDATIYPGADELCDGIDQNCDLQVDEGFADADDDGFDLCGGGIPDRVDCDDDDPEIHPDARESCRDDTDRDCDGLTRCDDPSCDGERCDGDGRTCQGGRCASMCDGASYQGHGCSDCPRGSWEVYCPGPGCSRACEDDGGCDNSYRHSSSDDWISHDHAFCLSGTTGQDLYWRMN